jgi:hypothetical protein
MSKLSELELAFRGLSDEDDDDEEGAEIGIDDGEEDWSEGEGGDEDFEEGEESVDEF